MEVKSRFKGLDLIDEVPEELWTEVCDIVHYPCFMDEETEVQRAEI